MQAIASSRILHGPWHWHSLAVGLRGDTKCLATAVRAFLSFMVSEP